MSRKFWLFIIALLGLMLLLEYQMPRRFQWSPSFAHDDRQPFGCYVFDSIFAQQMPRGYSVCRKSLSQLALEKSSPRAIVILRHAGVYVEDVNTDTLLTLAARGNRILYAHSYFDDDLCDTLHIAYASHADYTFQKLVNQGRRDTLFWVGDTLRYPSASYMVSESLISACLSDTATTEPLAVIHDWENREFASEHVDVNPHWETDGWTKRDSAKIKVPEVVALSCRVGRGELILVTTPLLFTNYGVLDCPAYVHRLMNRLKPLPVVRTEAYMPHYDAAESSPFRELLRRPPLRWALYLVLLGVVLLMGFNARRRQRAIPVEEPPRNYQLDFIRHIGTLQYLKKKKNNNPH